MAAKAGGEDETGSFESRVKSLFGSRLFDSVPNTAFSAATSTWSVAAGEVERRRWDRPSDLDPDEDRADTPCASAFYDPDGCFVKDKNKERKKRWNPNDDFEDLEEEEEEEEEEKDVAEEIRVSMGFDPTLDREEEEDSYDREALGKEGNDDRVYMKEVMDDGPYMNIHTAVPELVPHSYEDIHGYNRDPRADHMAAFVRLREDEESAKKAPHSPSKTKQEFPVVMPIRMSENKINVKPILKRKEDHDDTKRKKRVRFDADSTDERVDLSGHNNSQAVVPQAMAGKENSSSSSENPGVPDYVRNPSKYTCYTMDTADCDEETNKRAFEDFFDMVRRRNPDQMQPDGPVELPDSVTFIPRKKLLADAMSVDGGTKFSNGDSSRETGQYMGIAAGNSHEADVDEMEQDDDKTTTQQGAISSKKAVRRYRSNTSDE